MSIKVLLADDQALVRSGFRMILEAREEIEVVGEAGDGFEAIEETRRLLPDPTSTGSRRRAGSSRVPPTRRSSSSPRSI